MGCVPPSSPGKRDRPPDPPPQRPASVVWECTYCRTLNVAEREKCSNCGAPRMKGPTCKVPSPPPPPGVNFVKE